MNKTGLAAVILCGGRSSRMGQDKSLLPFGSETLLEREMRILRTVASRLVLVAAPDQDVSLWMADDVIVQRDRSAGLGPLEGIGQGLQAVEPHCELAYVASCDAPLVVPGWIERLRELIGRHSAAVPYEGELYHPLAALYRTEVGRLATRLVDAGQRRPAALLDLIETLRVPVEWLREVDPGLLSLANLNSPEDYQAALARVGQQEKQS